MLTDNNLPHICNNGGLVNGAKLKKAEPPAPPFNRININYLHTTILFVVTEPAGSMDRTM